MYYSMSAYIDLKCVQGHGGDNLMNRIPCVRYIINAISAVTVIFFQKYVNIFMNVHLVKPVLTF